MLVFFKMCGKNMNDLELNRFAYGVRQLVTALVSNTFAFSVLVLCL